MSFDEQPDAHCACCRAWEERWATERPHAPSENPQAEVYVCDSPHNDHVFGPCPRCEAQAGKPVKNPPLLSDKPRNDTNDSAVNAGGINAPSALSEAKETDACMGCGCRMERCRQYIAGGAIACCPDCQHAIIENDSAPQPQ